MTTSSNMSEHDEQNGRTYIFDAESAAEMNRLLTLDRLITKTMGGIFPESLDLSGVHRVLDIACGPGGWAQEVAFNFPDMKVVGIDISASMIQYAQAQAQVQGLTNLSFHVMDATRPLAFDDASFDLVNVRFVVAFMPPQVWPQFIQECMRLLRPGGILRLTECESIISNSFSAETMTEKGHLAMRLTGRSFAPTNRHLGITPMMGGFLRDAGFRAIQTRAYAMDASAGTEFFDIQYQMLLSTMEVGKLFMVDHMKVVTLQEYEEFNQQTIADMLSDTYRSIWFMLSVWGERP